MKHHHLTRALALITLLAAAPAALAQTPALVPYQGRVQTGTPPVDVNGTGQFKFALIDQTPVPFVQAAATVTRAAGVQSLTGATFAVTNAGTGYTTAPAVTVSAPQVGGGVQATVTATVSGGNVSGFTVVTPGSGYTANPTLTIAAPPAPTPTIIWNNNGPAPAAPVNAVSLTVTNGLYSVLLGDNGITNMAAITPSVFARPDLRLRVWFNGTQLSPDQRLAPAGYLAREATMFGSGHGYQHTDGTATVGTYVGNASGATTPSGWLGTRTDHPLHFFTKNSQALMTLATSGNLGIGTTTPTQAKLVVSGSSQGSATYSTLAYMNGDGAFGNDTHNDNAPASIYATALIRSDVGYTVSSDARTKTVLNTSDGAADLANLMQIQITDYQYKDTISRGAQKQKKVIAQQIEPHCPQAIVKSTDVVPDIYKKALAKDGWIELKTDLKAGERVRLIAEKTEGIHEVLEVKDGAFRTDFMPAGDNVFVYGREVNDFRTVDYDAISMLNVSATQELARQLDAEKAAVLALQKANATLEAENAALKAALAENTSKDKAQDEQLAALAKLLENRAPSAAVTTVSTRR